MKNQSLLLLSAVLLTAFLFPPLLRAQTARKPLTIGSENVPATALKKGTLFVSPDGKGEGKSATDPAGFSRLDLYSKNHLKIKPGDVVFFRGGIYSFSMKGPRRVYLKGGTKEKPVIYESYPGETAIFDGSLISTAESNGADWREGRLHLRENHTILRKVIVRHMPTYGVCVYGNHNIVEGCEFYHNHLSGLEILNYKEGYSTKDNGGSYNILRNNICHDNSDVGLKHHNYGDGDNADGITVHSGVGNVISHNTVYANSDDGIDTWKSMDTRVEYNLVYHHGIGPRGNGNGIKLGGAPPDSPLGTGAIALHNISFGNKIHGFTVNSGKAVIMKYNTSFDNGEWGFAVMKDSVLIGNLSVKNKSGARGWSKGKQQQNNSWQEKETPVFISIDPRSVDFLKTAGAGASESGGAYFREIK